MAVAIVPSGVEGIRQRLPRLNRQALAACFEVKSGACYGVPNCSMVSLMRSMAA